MLTKVTNLLTGDEYGYTLSPVRAVVAAYYQFEQNNFNTWEYDFTLVQETEQGYKCGNMFSKKSLYA